MREKFQGRQVLDRRIGKFEPELFFDQGSFLVFYSHLGRPFFPLVSFVSVIGRYQFFLCPSPGQLVSARPTFMCIHRIGLCALTFLDHLILFCQVDRQCSPLRFTCIIPAQPAQSRYLAFTVPLVYPDHIESATLIRAKEHLGHSPAGRSTLNLIISI